MIFRKGSRGCGWIHQVLIEAGYPIAPGELAGGVFGDSTYDAVREFQAHHVDRSGHALVEDGIVGDDTLWAMMNPGTAEAAYRAPGWTWDRAEVAPGLLPVVQAAVDQIGAREVPNGSNRGPQVDQFTGVTGAGEGPPWCLYFVSWAYARTPGGSPFGRIGSAWGMKEWGRAQDRILSYAAPARPGDVGVILRAPDASGEIHGHGMLIVHDMLDGRVCTVEGNSSNAVRALVRPRSMLSAIVRPIPA